MSKAKYYLGLDIGGTKCAASIGKIDDQVKIIGRAEVPTRISPEETLSGLLPFIGEWGKKCAIEKAGISCGGPLDCNAGIILTPPNLPGWHNFRIVDFVRERLGLSASLQNDANACAVAEWKFGAGKGTDNMIFLTFGTGLGAGLILDGKLFEGANGNAGEAGHIRLEKVGPVGYGKAGSFEGFCSGGGIARLAEMMAKRRKYMPKCVEEMGGFEKITTKKLSEYAFHGDTFARNVFYKSGKMLGKGLSILIDLFNPELIVLGGVYMRAHELMEKNMFAEIERETLRESRSVCRILPAALSENIGDYAAISVATM